MSKKNVIRGRFRLYPGQDDDLITWWKSLNDLPYGGKGQAIKEALRNGLGFSEQGSLGAREQGRDTSDPTHPSTHAQTAELLLDIRRVVEAAVIETLNQANVTVQESSKEHDLRDDSRVEELLTSLDRSLLLPEDDLEN